MNQEQLYQLYILEDREKLEKKCPQFLGEIEKLWQNPYITCKCFDCLEFELMFNLKKEDKKQRI